MDHLVLALKLSLSWEISVVERVSPEFEDKGDEMNVRKHFRASAFGTGKREAASLTDNPHAHPEKP